MFTYVARKKEKRLLTAGMFCFLDVFLLVPVRCLMNFSLCRGSLELLSEIKKINISVVQLILRTVE